LLICEYVTGGGFAGAPLPPGLAREGDMMLSALVKDVAALDGIDIVVVRDSRLVAMEDAGTTLPRDDSDFLHAQGASFDKLRIRGNRNGTKKIPHPELVEGRAALIPGSCRVLRVDEDPWQAWRDAIEDVDAVWPIAPETGGALLRLSEMVVSAGRALIGSRPRAVSLTTSKRETVEHLGRTDVRVPQLTPLSNRDTPHPTLPLRGGGNERSGGLPSPLEGEGRVGGTCMATHANVSGSDGACPAACDIPVVPTVRAVEVARDGLPDSSDGWVVKPDDGAGAEGTRLFRRADDLRQWLAASSDVGNLVIQPYLPGTAASLSVLCQEGRGWLLSCNRQDVVIENDAFGFRGCVVGGLEQRRPIYASVAAAVAAAIPDLWGYVGIDLIDRDSGPIVLEVNPRLTTSYVGVRQAIGINPAGLVLRLLQEDLGAVERPLRVWPQRVDVGGLDVG
jgi:predicted ATP-grasp superfamily ATP-dependent carboligase